MLAFWICCLLLPLHGGHNATSRLTTLLALCEDHSFQINRYDWTLDFSRTPDGRMYSNKAPAPMLFAAPVFCVLDRGITLGKDRDARDTLRRKLRYPYLFVLALLFEAIPFGLLVLAWSRHWRTQGLSDFSNRVTCLALLFGNTASLFMNSFFGHGFSAVWVLATLLAFELKRYRWLGFSLGTLLLSDYGAAFFFPGILYGLLREKRGVHSLLPVFVGALLPAALWMLYHISAFGSPFSLPQAYQNPVFTNDAQAGLGGVIDWFPKGYIVRELLVGSSRGLLITQPWIFLLLPLALLSRARVAPILLTALVGQFFMNASFSGWHGGDAAGPRYLSSSLVLAALSLSQVLDTRLGKQLRLIFVALLIPSLALFGMVYATRLTATPNLPLWTFLWNDWIYHRPITTPLARTGVVLIASGLAIGLSLSSRRGKNIKRI